MEQATDQKQIPKKFPDIFSGGSSSTAEVSQPPPSAKSIKAEKRRKERERAEFCRIEDLCINKFRRMTFEQRSLVFKEFVESQSTLYAQFIMLHMKKRLDEKDRAFENPAFEGLYQFMIEQSIQQYGIKGRIFRRHYYHICRDHLRISSKTTDDVDTMKLLAKYVNEDFKKNRDRWQKEGPKLKSFYLSHKEMKDLMDKIADASA